MREQKKKHPSFRSLRLASPAKLNLILRVLGKRPDRYHELFMLNTAVDLYDTISMEIREGEEIEIVCDHPQVPAGEDNLCHRAARRFFARFPSARAGLIIRIEKRIPVAAGLGGGSGNAAAVLEGLAALSDHPLSRKELLEIAAGVSADVPFFLFPGPAWVRGIGEILDPAPPLKNAVFALVFFPFALSTREVFSAYDDLTKKTVCDNLSLDELPDQVPEPKDWENDLEKAAGRQHPEIMAVQQALMEEGARISRMTGSGPTVFGLFESKEKAEKAAEKIKGDFNLETAIASPLQGRAVRILSSR